MKTRFSISLSLLAALAALSGRNSAGQGAITSGEIATGAISVAGETDSWTTVASQGDRIVVQIAEASGGAGFSPKIEVLAPDGTSMGASSGTVAARLDLQAHVNGTFTIAVSDASRTGTGTYRLQLAQIPGAFTVPAGDEGGALTNGENYAGTIDVGDLDLWSFSANEGDRIVLQIGEVSGGAGFTPLIELFAPNGARLAADSDGLVARVDAQASVGGTYTVVVSDAGQSGTGTYQLHLAQVPGAFVVPASDEGGALPDSVDQDGTIGAGDLDLWTFSAMPGDRVTVLINELTGGASFTPMIELFTPNGHRKSIAQGALTASLEAAIDAGGTYTVVVSDANQTGAGTYRLRLTRGTIGAPGPNVLVNGTSHLGSITSAGESNVWTFTATAGESISVHLGETTTSGFFPWLRLSGPTGVLLASDIGAAAAEISIRATNSGTFSVAVADGSAGHNQTGTYRLSMAKTGSPLTISPSDEGGALINGTSYLSAIETGDVDAWTFVANAGETIAIWMGEATAGSTLYPWLRLYGPDGVLLANDFNPAAAELTVRATNSGTFLVVVADGNAGRDGTGNYRLSLAKTGSPLAISPADEGGALVNGTTYTAAIETGDVDAWTFIANAGENIVLRAGETATETLYPWVRLFSPNGVLLDNDFNPAAAEVTFRATNSGTFTVIVGDANNGRGGTGNYRMSLLKTGSPLAISASDEGGALVNGATYLGVIDTGDIDGWTFTASAGENIVVRMGETTASGPLYPWLRLYSPNGVLLNADFNPAAAEVTFRATNSGTFQVVVGDGNNGLGGIGGYRLSLAKTGSPLTISASDEGGTLVNGTTYLGTIDTGDIDAWTFNANTGDSIIVRMGETTASSPLYPWLRLYSPNGVMLGQDFSPAAAEVVFRATNSGTFQVVVGDGSSGLGSGGNYRLSLAKTGEPLVITPGDEGGGMMASGFYDGAVDVGDVDAWIFTACAGDTISLRVEELVASSPLYPWIRLYGRDGSLLNSASGAASAQINRIAPANGTYLVVIGDGNSGIGGAGTYRLTVNGLYAGIKMCLPMRSGAVLGFQGAGGSPNSTFVVVTATDITSPAALWTPILTNNFGVFGEFSFTNVINLNLPEQYFRLRAP